MFRGSLHSGERTEQECGVDDNDDVFFDFFVLRLQLFRGAIIEGYLPFHYFALFI